MRRIKALNLGQRIVVIVALAGFLRMVGSYTINLLAPGDGWFAYVPSSPETYMPPETHGWHPLLWAALVVVWALASVWLLGLSRHRADG